MGYVLKRSAIVDRDFPLHICILSPSFILTVSVYAISSFTFHMSQAAEERAPCESSGAKEKSRKRPFRPEINEEPQNATQMTGKNNSNGGGNSATTGTSELEQMLKQKTLTRSKIKHPATMENLPGELLSNIFIRLPAKQLAQMRSVSKSWNALLSHPSFIKSHLHRSIHNNNSQILLVFYHCASYFDPKSFTAHPSQSPHLELTNFIKLPLPPVNPKSRHTSNKIKVIGSVNGLICSCYDDDVIQIWNPSLSAVSTLPPYLMRASPHYEIFFRFGFDPKIDDFKVVKLSCLIRPPARQSGSLLCAVKEWLQVEVYSMRKGSWGFTAQRFPSHVIRILDHHGICVDGHDGHLHWVGHIDEMGDQQTIVAFDLGSETFREMPFPDSVLDDTRFNALGVLGRKLCVMSWVVTKCVYEVWVMEEYGVAESWVKCHVFSQFSVAGSFGFTLHDEFLVEDNTNRLVLYDPNANKTKMFKGFDYDIYPYRADKVVDYVDSLVWVAPVKHDMVDGAGKS